MVIFIPNDEYIACQYDEGGEPINACYLQAGDICVVFNIKDKIWFRDLILHPSLGLIYTYVFNRNRGRIIYPDSFADEGEISRDM